MDLIEWLSNWPYQSTSHGAAIAVPDSAHDASYRAMAWRLTDVRVSSVSGGSIWFIRVPCRLPSTTNSLKTNKRIGG